MNRTCIALLALAVTGFVGAEEAKVTGVVDLPVLSSYVWRGLVLNDKAVVQPNLTVSKYGFSLNTWANYNLNGYYGSYGKDNQNEFSQVNLAASYATRVGPTNFPTSVSGGFIQYLFPNQTQMLGTNGLGRAAPGTHEVYGSVGLPNLPLAPTLQVNYDFDAVDGFYANLGISQGFEIVKDTASLVASASLGAGNSGYNSSYYGKSLNSLNDFLIGLVLPITIPGGVIIKPGIQ